MVEQYHQAFLVQTKAEALKKPMTFLNQLITSSIHAPPSVPLSCFVEISTKRSCKECSLNSCNDRNNRKLYVVTKCFNVAEKNALRYTKISNEESKSASILSDVPEIKAVTARFVFNKEVEIGISWTEVYEALRSHYYSFDEQTKNAFNKFYEPARFFSPEAVTNSIPLCIGISDQSGKYEIILPMHIYEQLLMFIEQALPDVQPIDASLLEPKSYVIYERFEAKDSKTFSKRHQKTKTKNRQVERLNNAKNETFLAKKMLGAGNLVFISLDIEAYEFDHSILLEIGWSLYDGKTNRFMDQHYINDQYRHLNNGKFVDNQKERFNFGTSVWCSLKQAFAELRKDLDWATRRDGGFVLVGHGLDSDIKYLHQQGFLWPDSDGQETENVLQSACKKILNTETIYSAFINDVSNPVSLGRALHALQIDAWDLHNAGNDAHYTLLLLLRLAGPAQMFH
ncbi:hypothetical protein BD560DRAFT_428566 [Blakeslea trispora]|nr:hypothetical protein BD560DRAFT_428566 [Blakeslea trispora]